MNLTEQQFNKIVDLAVQRFEASELQKNATGDKRQENAAFAQAVEAFEQFVDDLDECTWLGATDAANAAYYAGTLAARNAENKLDAFKSACVGMLNQKAGTNYEIDSTDQVGNEAAFTLR